MAAQARDHDYQAAEDYLSLIMSPKKAADYRQMLSAAQGDIMHRKAKDILRASQLALLDEQNKHSCRPAQGGPADHDHAAASPTATSRLRHFGESRARRCGEVCGISRSSSAA